MKANMSNALLARVSNEIDQGDPLWAILWVNEYLEAKDPLRLALVKKACSKLAQDHLTIQVMTGKTLAEIGEHQFTQTQTRRAYHTQSKRPVPRMPRPYRERLRQLA